MSTPADHAPATPRQVQIMRTDATLSEVMGQALTDRDMDTLTDAMAEKMDLERALHTSRDQTWNTWHHNQTGGEE